MLPVGKEWFLKDVGQTPAAMSEWIIRGMRSSAPHPLKKRASNAMGFQKNVSIPLISSRNNNKVHIVESQTIF